MKIPRSGKCPDLAVKWNETQQVESPDSPSSPLSPADGQAQTPEKKANA